MDQDYKAILWFLGICFAGIIGVILAIGMVALFVPWC